MTVWLGRSLGRGSASTNASGHWRPVAALCVGTLLLSGLGLVGPSVTSATGAADPPPPVPAELASASWSELDDTGGAVTARSQVRLAPGGTGVWGALITAGTNPIGAGASIEFAGLPTGISVAPAGVPGLVAKEEASAVTSCTRSDGGVSCGITTSIASGRTAVVAVTLTAGTGVGAGVAFDGQVRLVGGGSAAGSATVSTPLLVEVAPGVKDALFVRSEAEKLLRVGTAQRRVMHVYNLGGGVAAGSRTGGSTVQLTNVIPAKLAANSKATGTRWRCGAGVGSCAWRGQRLNAGEHTDPLTVSLKVSANARKGIPKHDGAHELSWLMRVSGSKYIAAAKHAESIHLMPSQAEAAKPKGGPKYIQVGDLSLSGSEMSKPRMGGRGRYLVMINNGGGKPVRHASVQLKVPGHAQVTESKTPGWRCSKAGVCVNRRSIPSHQSAPSIEFTIASHGDSKTSTKGVVAAVATWQGRGKDRTDRLVLSRDWHPALHVSAQAHNEAMATDVPGLKGMLTGKVGGLNGEKFGYQWRQVCPKGKGRNSCPQVTWHGPVKATSKTPVVTAAFTPPSVTKNTRLDFELKVAEGGASVRKRVSVLALASVKRAQPPSASKATAEKKLAPALNRNQKLGTKVQPAATVRIGGLGPSQARPGKRKELVAHVVLRGKGNKVREIQWLVNGEPADLLAGAKRSERGKRLLLRIPPGTRDPLLLSAIVKHNNGASTVASEIIKVGGKQSRSVSQPIDSRIGAGGQDRASAPASASASAPSFCDLFTAAQNHTLSTVTFDTIEMSLSDATATGASCAAPDASVGFDNGSVTINGIGLTGVTGSITAAGMNISTGLLNLPGPAAQGLSVFTFSGSPALSIPFTNNALSGMHGTITLASLPYLPAPSGWSVTPATIVFGPTAGGYQVSVDAQAQAPAPQDGTVLVTGSIGAGGAVNLTVTAANLMPIVGSTGLSTVFSGTGHITSQPGQPLDYAVNINMVPPANGQPFPLYGGVAISTTPPATLTWNTSGLNLSATLVLAMNNTTYSFTITGTITDFTDWSLTVASNATVIAMQWLTIDSPSGTISSTRDPSTGIATLSMDLQVRAQFDPSDHGDNFKVTSASGHLGIFCPAGTKDPSCANQVMQLQVDLVGTLNLVGENIPINTTVDVNIQTGGFTVAAGIGTLPADLESQTGMTFGNATAFYSDDPANDAALAGNPCMTLSYLQGATSVAGFIASFTMSDTTGSSGSVVIIEQATGTDTSGGFGLCLAGTFGSAGSHADVAMPAGTGSFAAGGVVFAKAGGDMLLNGVQTHLNPYNLVLWGEYHLPDSVSGMLTVDAITATLVKALMTGSSDQYSWTLSANVEFKNAYLVGDANSATSMAVTSAGITIARGSGYVPPHDSGGSGGHSGGTSGGGSGESPAQQEADINTAVTEGQSNEKKAITGALTFGIDVQMALVTEGMTTNGGQPGYAATGSSPDRISMPITGSIGYAFTGPLAGSWSLNASMGNNGTTTWNNAFGVSGLDISEIAIGAQIGPEPKANWIGFAAAVSAPPDDTTLGGVTSVLGLQPGTNISLAVQISEAAPCFGLSIGDPTGTTLAINAFGGIVQADYFELFIAPQGCAIASNVPNMPVFGYAFDFVGSVVGVQAQIHGLYSVSGEGGDISLDFDLSAFNLAGLDVGPDNGGKTCPGNKLNGPCLHLEVTSKGPLTWKNPTLTVDLAFSGAVNLWGVLFVGVSGSMDIALGSANPKAELNLTGDANLDLFGIFTESAALTLDADFDLWDTNSGSNWAPQFTTFDIGASVPMDFYFINAQVILGFDYSNGFVSLVYVSFGITVDLLLVEAGVTVTLAYCNPVTGTTCNVAGNPADPGSVSTNSTNGDVDITATGMVGYWLFGWHTASATLLDISIPVSFANPVSQPPPPVTYSQPQVPINDWPQATWNYQPEMFMGIGWDATELATASGVAGLTPNPGALPYGTAVNDTNLGQPSVKFEQGSIALSTPTASSDGQSATVTGTVVLPETPTYAKVTGGRVPPARLAGILPSIAKCAGGTKTFTVNVPKWQGGHPLDSSSAALVVSEINWRIFLSSVIETSSISGGQSSTPLDALENYTCGYGMITGATTANPGGTSSTDPWITFPPLQDWLTSNSQGTAFNLAYPQPHPGGGDIAQFCLTGFDPSSAYGAACANNIADLDGSWGTGWGAGSTSGPPSG